MFNDDKDYYYELKNVDGNDVVIHKFRADLDSYQLALHLKDFLLGCSWSPERVNDILRLEEFEYDTED